MKFTKMEALGNDFILLNKIILPRDVIKICDRHFGVGADGVLMLDKSKVADIKMVHYNSDGSKSNMCGNGIRCFTKYLIDNKIITKNPVKIETGDGVKIVELIDDKFKVNMGTPQRVNCTLENVLNAKIKIENEEIIFSATHIGVPHAIIFVDGFDFEIEKLGKKIENNPIFPEKINVNFVKKIDDDKYQIKTWERGAGRTLGCGTGSCAVYDITKKLNLSKSNKIVIINDGGKVEIEEIDNKIYLIGKAHKIFSGEIEIL